MFDAGQKRTLVTVCLGMFMAFLDGTVVNLALPVIQKDMNTAISALQWIVDGYVLFYAAFMLSGGSLADRFGRRRLFLTGLAIFTVGSLVCAIAPDIAVLVGGRILQGLGGALFVPATLALLTHAFPDPRQRTQAIGIWSSVSGISLALGPVAGGVLVDKYGWQSVFVINLPIGAIVLLLGARWLTESSAPQARRLDLPGQVLAAVALAALTYALIEGPARGWGSPLILSLFAVAAAGIVLFVVVEARTAEPMLPLGLFRSVGFATCVSIAMLVGFGLLGSFFFLSLFLQNVQHYSPLAAGVRLLPAVLAVAFCAPTAGRLAGRFGPRFLMGAGMTIVGVALLTFGQVGPDTPYARWWVILLGIGAGVGLTMTPMIAAIVGSVHPSRAGLASATGNTGQQVGGMLGIAGLGTVIAGHFPVVFKAKTALLGLPAGLSDRIAHGTATGTIPSGIGLPRGVDPGAVMYWARYSFVAGMHRALLIAGVIYLVGALIAVVLLRNVAVGPQGGPPAAEGAPGPGAPERDVPVVPGGTSPDAATGTADPAAGTGGAAERAEAVAARRRRRTLLFSVLFELPVAVMLLAAWFSIPLLGVHVALGSAFMALALAHLGSRPAQIAAVWRAVRRRATTRHRRRMAADAVLTAGAAGATISGFLQWSDPHSGPVKGLHSLTSFVAVVMAARHLWVRRRVLIAHLRPGELAGGRALADRTPTA